MEGIYLNKHSAVIARLARAIQYSSAPVHEPIGRGVLDHPLSRVMTTENLAAHDP
jgi:hypothetical protein